MVPAAFATVYLLLALPERATPAKDKKAGFASVWNDMMKRNKPYVQFLLMRLCITTAYHLPMVRSRSPPELSAAAMIYDDLQ